MASYHSFTKGRQTKIELVASKATKISHVNLYSGMAEITRKGKVALQEGDNSVVIEGLTDELVDESLRIEGQGPCMIHDVSISSESSNQAAQDELTSSALKSLTDRRQSLAKALLRVEKCIAAVSAFSSSIRPQFVSPGSLPSTQIGIDDVAAELDGKLIELETETEVIDMEIEAERDGLRKEAGESALDARLRKKVTISIQADRECEVELILIYAVHNASWDATYDVYVKMDTKEKPVSLRYKAAITQDTAESWEDVSLALETVTPTFGLDIPELTPWTLSVNRPLVNKSAAFYHSKSARGGGPSLSHAAPGGAMMDSFSHSISSAASEATELDLPMEQRVVEVTSKGDVNATFSVPGLTSIPSDGEAHNVTICELALDASMSWVVVPKKSEKVHLTAKIKNESEYTFLQGSGSIYVDGSFISRSDIPAVSPQESFDCPLGIDPSIRVTYYPRSKRTSRTGSALTFGRGKSSLYLFEQRISIHNAKAPSTGMMDILRIRDQIPVSEDEKIEIKLREPALALPNKDKEKSNKDKASESVLVKTSEKACNVQAWWDSGDDDESSGGEPQSHLGKDGKIVWICEGLPAQSKFTLSLSWEVICPQGTDVAGIDET